MDRTPIQPKPHRLLTQFMVLAVCVAMCIPAGMAIAQNPADTPTTLTYTYTFPTPTISPQTINGQTYSQLHLAGAIGLGKDIGGPTIPVSFVKLALPPLTTVDTITVIGETATVNTNGILSSQPVTPYQPEIPISSDIIPPFQFNTTVYQLTTPYPQSLYDDYTVGYCRGYTILSLALTPVQYIPAQGILLTHPLLTITITLKSAPMNQLFRNSADDASWVEHLVSNPEVVQSYQAANFEPTEYPGGLCGPSESHQYVIITTTDGGLNDWDTSGTTPYNWDSLMTSHSDLSATLVTEQDIAACADYDNDTPMFNDLQAHIREFCKDAYQDWGTQYVLIGADGEWIPARDMDYDYESDVDADIYWANLDNSFNANQNSYWGEEGDAGFDLYSELYIGRLTCDVPQDVSNWMTKSFKYASEGNPNILDNAAFYGGVLGFQTGCDFVDYSAIKGTNNWLGPTPGAHGPYPTWLGFQYGFQTWNLISSGIPYNLTQAWAGDYNPNPGWQGGSEAAAKTGLKNAINNDLVSLLSGVAHADPSMSLDVYDSAWESDYHNTYPFFITDAGCHCGDYDDADDGVLHSMLFHSDTELAFGCTFNTCYGWGSSGDTNSSSALQMKLFWDYCFDIANHSESPMNWQFGRAHAFSKDEMAPTVNWTSTGAPGSWRGVIEGCMYFGDPAQLVKPPRDNDAPATPSTPAGPGTGSVAISYSFTTSTTDPDDDDLYYFFDWGDGTDSGWVGPFNSGVTGTASHIWTSGGTFSVKVKAKDFIGATTDWSAATSIMIGAPILELQKIKGGLGVSMVLGNIGEGSAVVDWRVTITGGIGDTLTLQNFGHLDSVPVGEPTTVKLYPVFFGIGRIKINIQATAVYGNSLNEDVNGFLLGPFVIPRGV